MDTVKKRRMTGKPKTPQQKELNRLIGERLMYFRKEKGMGQVDLARQLGVSPSVISNLERGKTIVGIMSLLEIVSILGIGIEDLLPEYARTRDQGLDADLYRLRDLLMDYDEEERHRIVKAIGDLKMVLSG